jgi:IS30 family transposase
MQIPDQLKVKWLQLKSKGDTGIIAKELNVHPETIRVALRKGVCSDRVFKAIANYYDKKEKDITKYL